ncbi:hypothetical protein [Acinetobacter radioresistens]|uniref:hypothetical protein n=1 Tax=Acinetobacter radioresistens TaxID=40216 RepID=UPI000E72410E|nr:hypothetical protein [Acinetobacter radioresistens]RJL70160.1 hypothetical protein D5055_11520 [Acinetobacter radioresistens]
MYIALEGTNELLKEKLFAQCLEFYKNRNQSVDVFHPVAPMPSYVWWEQVFFKFSSNKVFTSELLVTRAKYHLKHIKFNGEILIGVGSIFTNLIENWPGKDCLAKAHIRNLLTDLHPVPVPDKVIYIGKSRDANEKHQIYMHIFENSQKYGFENLKIFYIEENVIESNPVQGCDQLFEILLSTT